MENLADITAINSHAADLGAIPADSVPESGKWSGKYEVLKFDDDAHHAAWLRGEATPTEVVGMPNTLLLTGLNEMFRILVGASANTYTQANSQIGVGDSSTAATSAQTDLQASTNKTYVTTDVSGGITTGANGGTTNTVIFQSTFGSAQANYAWNEIVVKQATSGICLNRAVSSLGTKASSTTWVARLTITIT